MSNLSRKGFLKLSGVALLGTLVPPGILRGAEPINACGFLVSPELLEISEVEILFAKLREGIVRSSPIILDNFGVHPNCRCALVPPIEKE